MRPVLVEIEQIERYLLQEMSSDELLLFEQELKGSVDLQEKVEVQKIVLRGIDRKVFKVAASAAFAKGLWIKKMWWGGAVVATSFLIVLVVVLLINKTKETKTHQPQNNLKNEQQIQDSIPPLKLHLSPNNKPHPPHSSIRDSEPSSDSIPINNWQEGKPKTEQNFQEEIKQNPRPTNTYKKKYDTLWSGQSIKDESINIVVAKFNASIKNTMILLADGTIQSDLEGFNAKLWSINDKKTKITINNQVYFMKWDSANKTFKVKLKEQNTSYHFVFSAGGNASVSSGVELNLNIKEKK